MVTDVGSVNIFEYQNEIKLSAGDQLTVYMQLIDRSVDGPAKGFNPPGRRYCPAASATLTVVLNNVWTGGLLTKVATQPYPTLDASIWSFTIASADPIGGTIDLLLTLNESGVIHTGRVKTALWVDTPLDPLGQCGPFGNGTPTGNGWNGGGVY
jgi:hypothetical protein